MESVGWALRALRPIDRARLAGAMPTRAPAWAKSLAISPPNAAPRQAILPTLLV